MEWLNFGEVETYLVFLGVFRFWRIGNNQFRDIGRSAEYQPVKVKPSRVFSGVRFHLVGIATGVGELKAEFGHCYGVLDRNA